MDLECRAGLNRTVEQLRQHALATLKTFDPSRPIQDRAEFVVNAVENQQRGETLSLLVVAQESLFQWQQLRIARVEATEPQHLQKVLDDACELLAHQMAADGELYRRAQTVLDAVARTEDLDRFAMPAGRKPSSGRRSTRPRRKRRSRPLPNKASVAATQALGAATEGYTAVSSFLSKTTREGSKLFGKRRSRDQSDEE